MVEIRRVRFTQARVNLLKTQIKEGNTPKWAQGAQIRGGEVHIGTRKVVPLEKIDETLRARMYTKNKKLRPVPFARDAGFEAISEEFFGISRRQFYDWLGRQSLYQQQARRPGVYSKGGQRLSKRGVLQFDLVEAMPKDVKSLGRTKKSPSYILTMIDLLTGFLVASEVRRKTAAVVAPVFKQALSKMTKNLGVSPHEAQSGAGGEFAAQTASVMKNANVKHKVVTLGPRVEQINAVLQNRLYTLIKQRRGGTFPELIEEAVQMVNHSKNRITGFSPVQALTKSDASLARSYNQKRGAASRVQLKKVGVGDLVRVLRDKRKGTRDYKSYRGKHYSDPLRVSAIRGRVYTVAGKTYPRDRLIKVAGVDKKSDALLKQRAVRKVSAVAKTRRARNIKEIKAAARVAPRRAPKRGN